MTTTTKTYIVRIDADEAFGPTPGPAAVLHAVKALDAVFKVQVVDVDDVEAVPSEEAARYGRYVVESEIERLIEAGRAAKEPRDRRRLVELRRYLENTFLGTKPGSAVPGFDSRWLSPQFRAAALAAVRLAADEDDTPDDDKD